MELTERHKELVKFILEKGKVQHKDIKKADLMSSSVLATHLNNLVNTNVLKNKKEGKRKELSFYWVNPRYKDKLRELTQAALSPQEMLKEMRKAFRDILGLVDSVTLKDLEELSPDLGGGEKKRAGS